MRKLRMETARLARLSMALGACASTSWAVADPAVAHAASLGGLESIDARVHIEGCPTPLASELRRLIAVEMASFPEAETPGNWYVFVACSGHTAKIRAGRDLDIVGVRQIDLHSIEERVRARVLALTIAELVREEPTGSDVEELPSESPLEEPPVLPPSDPQPSASILRLTAQGTLTRFARQKTPLYGGGFRFDYLGLENWVVGLETSLSTAHQNVELGSTHVLIAHWEAHVAWTRRLDSLSTELGIGHRVGIANVAGRVDADTRAMGSSLNGIWGGPLLFGSLLGHWASPLAFALRVETGWTTLPVTGHVARGDDVRLDGPWVTLGLGVGLDL